MNNIKNPDQDAQSRAEERRQAERRKRRARMREERARAIRRQRILAVFAAFAVILLIAGGTLLKQKAWAQSSLSEKVLDYRDTVKKYAKKEKIEKYGYQG